MRVIKNGGAEALALLSQKKRFEAGEGPALSFNQTQRLRFLQNLPRNEFVYVSPDGVIDPTKILRRG